MTSLGCFYSEQNMRSYYILLYTAEKEDAFWNLKATGKNFFISQNQVSWCTNV